MKRVLTFVKILPALAHIVRKVSVARSFTDFCFVGAGFTL